MVGSPVVVQSQPQGRESTTCWRVCPAREKEVPVSGEGLPALGDSTLPSLKGDGER